MDRRAARRFVAAVAGLLLVAGTGFVVVLGPTPAGATSVNDETTLRAAFITPAETQVDLTADIMLSFCPNGAIFRNSATAMVVDGHGHTVTQTCAVGDNSVFRQVGSGVLTFQNIAITGGNDIGGGGIFTTAGVSLTNSTVSGNSSLASGGGGIHAGGSVSLTNSTVSGNTVNGLVSNGGGIEAVGNVSLTNSTVSGNTVSGGGGQGGGIFAVGSVSLTNSTVSGNTAGDGGVGGGISAVGAVSLTNSTVSGNTSIAGGGVFGTVSLSLVYATVVGNTAPTAANIHTPVGGGVTLTSFGSVVALPQGGGTNCVGVTASNGSNWDDDGSCGFGAGPGDHSNAGNPLLGGLVDNGGPTQTRLPLMGSPLIDAIPNGACQLDGASGVTTDQRGFARPSPTGGACDIGAAEVQATPTPTTPPSVVARFTG